MKKNFRPIKFYCQQCGREIWDGVLVEDETGNLIKKSQKSIALDEVWRDCFCSDCILEELRENDKYPPKKEDWKMKDQYEVEIPKDLVLMPLITSLTSTELKIVTLVAWYEAKGVIMVSARAIDYLSEDDPLDAGVDICKSEVSRIAEPLKRWSVEDGFYHA